MDSKEGDDTLQQLFRIPLEFAEVIIVANGFVDKINFECYPVYCRQSAVHTAKHIKCNCCKTIV